LFGYWPLSLLLAFPALSLALLRYHCSQFRLCRCLAVIAVAALLLSIKYRSSDGFFRYNPKMNELPIIGYGTWVDSERGATTAITTPSDVMTQIQTAYRAGYRHFDTAGNYGTEMLVQTALMTMIVEGEIAGRSSLFVTTKYGSGRVPTPSEMYRHHVVGGIPVNELPVQDLELATATGVPGVVSGFQLIPEDVEQVDFGYFDLILLHNPPLTSNQDDFELRLLADWKRLVALQRAGYAKHIGVSNFYDRQLGILIDLCRINGLPRPYANQIELHPRCQMPELIIQCQSYNVLVIAHSPLGGTGTSFIVQRPEILKIAQRINGTAAQVALAFLIRQGVAVVTRSKQESRMVESLQALSYVDLLSDDDMLQLKGLNWGYPLIELAQTCWLLNAELR
jgi:diketogulonate reductase-like aldo/keto reductase